MRKAVIGLKTITREWSASAGNSKCGRLSSLMQLSGPVVNLSGWRPFRGTTPTVIPFSFNDCVVVRTVTHQVRKYAPTPGQAASEQRRCWNCQQYCGRRSHMLCKACGYLQDVDTQVNFFELLNCPSGFVVEQTELTQHFRQLQTLAHPDKYSNKTSREQSNSADWSALINKAYKTLSTPIERGQYLLQLQGQQLPQDNSVLDKEFLMEMMERNEEVEEANTNSELQQLNDRITQELNERARELNAQFELNALEAAKMLLVKMKYLLSIQTNIKNKIQSMLGT